MDPVTRTLLERIQEDVKEIKAHIVGDGDRDGLILEVDRLKRSRQNTNNVLWVLFTAGIGTLATAIGAFLTRS